VVCILFVNRICGSFQLGKEKEKKQICFINWTSLNFWRTVSLRWRLVHEFGRTERLRSTLRVFGWRVLERSGSKKSIFLIDPK
jgi:hypothetical protein